MRKSSVEHNIELLSTVAHRLDELCSDVIFVGGCVAGLLISDKAAPDVRFTVDVDCIINIITRSDYYRLEKKLRNKGFKNIPFGDHPLCRWDCDGVLIDIMPIDKKILGFSNKWYKEAIDHAISRTIKKSIDIKIISAPYFLATKLEAFKDRGKKDFLSSHDMEDIVSLIDGRAEIIEDIKKTPSDLRKYLAIEFLALLNDDKFIQALPGHFNYSYEIQSRKKIVEERIKLIVSLGK